MFFLCAFHGSHSECYSSLQEEAMEKANMMMKKAMRRLNIAYKHSRHNFLLYVMLFGIALFVVVYMLAKLYRLGRSII